MGMAEDTFVLALFRDDRKRIFFFISLLVAFCMYASSHISSNIIIKKLFPDGKYNSLLQCEKMEEVVYPIFFEMIMNSCVLQIVMS